MVASTDSIHERILTALSGLVRDNTDLSQKPFDVWLEPPLPGHARFYAYSLTNPPGGRSLDEYKIQLIVPGQARGERASFDVPPDGLVFLVGYSGSLDVFVLWDAGAYQGFSFSRNVQVKASVLHAAMAGEIATQIRRLSGGTRETVIGCAADQLARALQVRIRLSERRLLSGGS